MICPSVCLYTCTFAISSQTLQLIRLKFSVGNGRYRGVVYGEFGKDQSKLEYIMCFITHKVNKIYQKKNSHIKYNKPGHTVVAFGVEIL